MAMSVRYLCHTVLFLSLAAAMPSCGREEAAGAEPAPDRSGVQVGLRISLGDTDADATRSGSYDDGTGTDYENYIDFVRSDYRILFFDTDDRYLTAFRPEECIPLDDNPLRSRVYEVRGKIDKPLKSAFKVVVLANWPAYPDDAQAGITTIEEICTAAGGRYDYEPPFVLSADRTIPMFGVKRCEGVAFHSDMLTWLGEVYLLRAMAKIEVKCPTDGWTLRQVSLHGYNRAGFCAPRGVYEESDYVVGGEYEHAPGIDLHLVEGAGAEEFLDFRPTGDGRFVVYVPEYRNALAGAPAADASWIRVRFEERTDRDYRIDFKYYVNPPEPDALGAPFDIRRNYYYKFSISKSAEYDEPQIRIDVYAYDQYDLRPIFGQDKKDKAYEQ